MTSLFLSTGLKYWGLILRLFSGEKLWLPGFRYQESEKNVLNRQVAPIRLLELLVFVGLSGLIFSGLTFLLGWIVFLPELQKIVPDLRPLSLRMLLAAAAIFALPLYALIFPLSVGLTTLLLCRFFPADTDENPETFLLARKIFTQFLKNFLVSLGVFGLLVLVFRS